MRAIIAARSGLVAEDSAEPLNWSPLMGVRQASS